MDSQKYNYMVCRRQSAKNSYNCHSCTWHTLTLWWHDLTFFLPTQWWGSKAAECTWLRSSLKPSSPSREVNTQANNYYYYKNTSFYIQSLIDNYYQMFSQASLLHYYTHLVISQACIKWFVWDIPYYSIILRTYYCIWMKNLPSIHTHSGGVCLIVAPGARERLVQITGPAEENIK